MAKKKVLIIDDDKDLTRALEVLLTNQELLVNTAANISEGAEKIDSFKPDLIILDVNLETTNDGFKLCKSLNDNEKFKDIAIVILTSIEIREVKKGENIKSKISNTVLTRFNNKITIEYQSQSGEIISLEIQEFISKPIRPQALVDIVNRLLFTNKLYILC